MIFYKNYNDEAKSFVSLKAQKQHDCKLGFPLQFQLYTFKTSISLHFISLTFARFTSRLVIKSARRPNTNKWSTFLIKHKTLPSSSVHQKIISSFFFIKAYACQINIQLTILHIQTHLLSKQHQQWYEFCQFCYWDHISCDNSTHYSASPSQHAQMMLA